MSGGRFDYTQYHITTIADTIESILDRQGKEIPKDELYGSDQYYKDYPSERFYETIPISIQQEMLKGIKILREAAIYAQRIDWYLSGDDGDETFMERLKSDLEQLNKQSK